MSTRLNTYGNFYAPNVLASITDENWSLFKKDAIRHVGVKVVGPAASTVVSRLVAEAGFTSALGLTTYFMQRVHEQLMSDLTPLQ